MHLGVAVNQMLAFLMHFAIHVFLHQGIAKFLQLLGHQHLPGAAVGTIHQSWEKIAGGCHWLVKSCESDSNFARTLKPCCYKELFAKGILTNRQYR